LRDLESSLGGSDGKNRAALSYDRDHLHARRNVGGGPTAAMSAARSADSDLSLVTDRDT
jgi:hypothetical protein